MNLWIFAIALSSTTATISAGAEPSADVNEKIAAYCRSQVGQAVGDGQCSDLAVAALRAAEARLPRPGEGDPGPGDYVWGRRVLLLDAGSGALKREGKLSDLKPGDIIQFRDAVFYRRSNGRYERKAAAHHTAIVAKPSAAQGSVQVWEQNYNGKKTVILSRYDLAAIQKGWVRIYRPSAAESPSSRRKNEP